MMRKFAVLTVLVLATCCVGPPTPRPQEQPRPVPAPLPAPAPPPLATGPDWRDWPLNAGDWTYRRDVIASFATYGVAGRSPEFVMRCELGRGIVALSRPIAAGAPSAGMTVTTTEGTMTYPAATTGVAAEARLAARDTMLDAMSFSRGRFMVTMAGAPRLIAPAWPEIARVIEDCR